MIFEFGPFKLDEPGRVLRLAEREIPLQPRVFDLLIYLVHRRERVVPKEELLTALWPGVTVTEASLQRAVSLLRDALRKGGMEEMLRSFPRIGYRFCLDEAEAAETKAASSAPQNESDGLVAARSAVTEQRWNDAVAIFAKADGARKLSAADLDLWALSLQCLGKPSDAIPLLVRSITEHTQSKDNEAAASGAVTLSCIYLERGEAAVAKGWIARAQDLVTAQADSRSAGKVRWMEARLAATDGDPQRALALAEDAYTLGHQSGSIEAEALGLMYRGFYRLSLGDTRAGLADQDHAAALALSGNVDPITSGVLYCNILWACRTFGDWARATQWTLGYQQLCSNSGMDFTGSCQLHRAEVLATGGSLRQALTHIHDALARLSDDAPWAQGDAHRVLGDIEAAIGNDDAAMAAYEKAYAFGWDPEPGHAMLLLERGEVEAAYVSLERSLIGTNWWTLQRQGMLLAHLALVAAHAGKSEKAEALIDDLAGQSERWPMPSVRALTNEASALIFLKRGDANEALRRLHLARQLWTSIDSRINAARLRLRIASLQLDMGDRPGAAAEMRAAEVAAGELDSDKLKKACRELKARLE